MCFYCYTLNNSPYKVYTQNGAFKGYTKAIQQDKSLLYNELWIYTYLLFNQFEELETLYNSARAPAIFYLYILFNKTGL